MKVTDLEKCIAILLEVARRRGVSEIALPANDGYWTITSQEWTRIYEQPTPGVGSFSDDEQQLLMMLEDPTGASAVDLERVAHLLCLLSDQLVS